jgi:hypothetical protein
MEGQSKPFSSSIFHLLLTIKESVKINIKQNNFLGDTKIFYSFIATLEDEGPVFCKLHFSKIEDDWFTQFQSDFNRIRDAFNLYKHPNVLVYDKIFNIQKKAVLGVRQFICYNLNEKMHRIPKLTLMEKKWLVF